MTETEKKLMIELEAEELKNKDLLAKVQMLEDMYFNLFEQYKEVSYKLSVWERCA